MFCLFLETESRGVKDLRACKGTSTVGVKQTFNYSMMNTGQIKTKICAKQNFSRAI